MGTGKTKVFPELRRVLNSSKKVLEQFQDAEQLVEEHWPVVMPDFQGLGMGPNVSLVMATCCCMSGFDLLAGRTIRAWEAVRPH